ncbi:PREDICTED: uncharacterized protein LOC109475362 [Branchiostoma belcheri]|uniref:Uncharacterized protein LOC109475362 n=1 Tax=Branchiostoma belcheri TaxID=7741 RepID=A0A6P4ZPD3_BRABE|nr:PREDICTED: uncharacterized protein LOC109475362 [Branchiostoma belcheri]
MSTSVVFYSNGSLEDIQVGAGQTTLKTQLLSMNVSKLSVNGGHLTVEPDRLSNDPTELFVENAEIVSGTLELNVQTEVGYLSQTGGSVRGRFDIIAEEFEWSSGTVIGDLGSELLVKHLKCLGTGTKTLQQRSLELQKSGTFVGDAAGIIEINGHGNFVIAKEANLMITAEVTIDSDLGMFENKGMLTNALQSNGKVLAVNGHFRNTGIVQCLDDTLMKVSGTGQWEGALTTGSNATVEIADGHHLFLSSFEVNGTGKLVVSSGSVTMHACSVSAAVMQISAPVYIHGEIRCFIQSLLVSENGVFISNSPTTVGHVQQNGGVVRALSSLTVAEYDLIRGTLQSHNVTEVDQLQWSSGTVTGGKLYAGTLMLTQGTEKIASQVTVVVLKSCMWSEEFGQTLGLRGDSALIIAQQASMDVNGIAALSSENSNSYQGRLENHGQINVKQTFTSSAEFINFGNLSVSEGTIAVTKKSENRGYINIGQNSKVKIRDHFSYPSSVIEGNGKLTLTQGTIKLLSDTLKQKIIHVTGAIVSIVLTSRHTFLPKEVKITGGQVDLLGNKDNNFELESLTIAGGAVKIHSPCNISKLAMTGGSLKIMAPTDITEFDFFAGQLVGVSDLGSLTVDMLMLHSYKNKDDAGKILQAIVMQISQQFRWLTPINKDTVGMQDGSVIRLLSDCETTLQGQLEFQGNSETIENYGNFVVYGSDENLPHRTTSIRIGPHFNNAGTVWVQESSMVSFQSTAHISGSMVAHRNANVEFVNHYSTAPQNIAGGRLAVRNSNLWILSNNFTTLNINSGGHVNFVSTEDPVHNSVFEEVSLMVSLNRGSVNFDSDVSIGVFEVTGGTVKSTSPNGVIQAQQLTFHEDTESSTIEDCNVSGREIHFIGSNVALVTSSLRIQHSGIAHSSVQLDMLNSSVLVEEGATLAIKHKMALQTTEMEDSSILNVAGTVHVKGPKFVSSAAVVLQTTGKFTVTKDFSELDIQMTGIGSGTFNINCSHPTITFRGPGDLVLDKGSFIGPNATINVHGGHAVITTGIEHQLLESSGLKITLKGTGTMTLNSSQFNETPNPFTVNEVLLKSLSSNLYLSDAIPKVQKMIITGGQVHGNAKFDTVILQSNLQLTDCSFDIDNLIIRGGNNDDKEIQASKIGILRSLQVETDATLTLTQASVLRLASSATFTMENALEITASGVDSEASWFTNEGRITVSLGADRIASIGAKFNHSGELLIEDGHLSMNNDSIIRGSLQVGTSSRLTLSAGVHRIQRGSSCLVQGKLLVESSASVDVDSDDMSIESVTSHGSVTLRGETCISGLELAEGNFEVGGNAGFGALDMKTGTLSVKGDMTVNGPVKWQSGTIHLSAGSSLTVNGDFIQAISDGDLENQGGTFTISPANSCGVHTDCTSCQGGGDCSWYPTANLCVHDTIAGPSTCSARHCRQKLACSNFGTTETCSSQQNCTWCLASDMCVQHEQCPSAAAFWTNSAGGEWHAASNWFNDTTPGEGSDAFLTSLSEDYEVRITNAISLQALEIGSQCDHTFSQGCDTMQTLTVQRDLQVGRLLVRRNARLILGGGNLVIGSSLNVDGRMEWRQGTIRGDGRINVIGQLTIHQGCYYCHKNLQVPLENYGRITLQTTSISLTMSPRVNITNAGEILIKSNGVINGGTIYNEGLIYSTTPTANINSNMVQSGHLVLQQSRLQIGGNVEFLGQNSVDEGSEVLLKSGSHVFSIGSTVPSSLTLEGGTTTINTTGNTIRSLHLKNSATLQSDKELQVENVYLEKGTLLGNGDYQINTFRWWEGNIEGMKSILVTKEMAFDDDRYYSHRKAMAESTILLQGRALVQGSQATLTMSRNASFEVTSSGEIHVPLSTTLSLRCSDGTCRTTNNGYVDVIGSLVISTDLASRGSVAVDGRVDLSGNSKFESGKIWVGSSGTLHLAGNQKDVSIGALVGVDIYGSLSVADGDVVVSSQKIAYINNIHCSGGLVQFTNTTNLKTIGTVYVRNSQITLHTGDATGLNVGKIEGRYSGNVILASPTTVSVIVLQENSSPGATIRLDSPKHAYKVLDSVTLNDGQHQIVGTVDEGGTKPTLYIEGQMNLQHYYRHFYFQNVDVSISGTLSHTCRDNRNYGVYLADGSTLTVEESGLAEVGGCNWLHSGSLPTSFTNNGVLRFHDDPTSIYNTFVQNGTMYTTANKNLHLYGQSILQGNVTIGKNAAVNFRGGSQHHILSDAMHEYSSTLNLLDDNTVLNVSTNDLRLSKVKVDSQGGRLLLFSRSDVGSVNLLELRRGSIQVGFSQLTTDEIFLTTG